MVFAKSPCDYCGKIFRYPIEFGQIRFCSATCRVTAQPPRYVWEYKGATNNTYYSPARRRKIRQGDSIDPLVVYLAYDWTCHLCCGRIDPTLRVPHPMCATIEHVVSLSQDGTHTWDNVKPAHKKCNEDKELYEESITSERSADTVS